MTLEAIEYENGRLEILDQLKLPHKVEYRTIRSSEDAFNAIRTMQVRGAPAIAMVAMLGIAVDLNSPANAGATGIPGANSSTRALQVVQEKLKYLVQSRPTAVNLQNAAKDLGQIAEQASCEPDSTFNHVFTRFQRAAVEMLQVDRNDNQRMGRHGSEYIIHAHKANNNHDAPVSVITHCNTGSLATAGYGTALGVIRSLHTAGHLRRVFCTETRPYNQGCRLTAFELVHDKIPATLITDSMAAALMQLERGPENIAGIVVGADRIAANGDTANKIGTYALAIEAKHHSIPFYVAAPTSTIDFATPSGDTIKIEERPGEEMTRVSGPHLLGSELLLDKTARTVQIAATGINIWNPAFDITPAILISAIFTEKGVIRCSGAKTNVQEELERGLWVASKT